MDGTSALLSLMIMIISRSSDGRDEPVESLVCSAFLVSAQVATDTTDSKYVCFSGGIGSSRIAGRCSSIEIHELVSLHRRCWLSFNYGHDVIDNYYG